MHRVGRAISNTKNSCPLLVVLFPVSQVCRSIVHYLNSALVATLLLLNHFYSGVNGNLELDERAVSW